MMIINSVNTPTAKVVYTVEQCSTEQQPTELNHDLPPSTTNPCSNCCSKHPFLLFPKDQLFSSTMAHYLAHSNFQVTPHIRRHPQLIYTHNDLQLEALRAPGKPVPMDKNVHTWGVNHPSRNGDTFLDVWNQCIAMTTEVLATNVPMVAKRSRIITSNLDGYEHSVKTHIIASTIIGLHYGFDQVLTSDNRSLTAIGSHVQTQLNIATARERPAALWNYWYYHNRVLVCFDFLMKWHIPPQHGILVPDVMKANMQSFHSVMTRSTGRAGKPLWSAALVSTQPLRQADASVCDGHMLEFAILLDRVIYQFERYLPKNGSFILPWENVQNMFELNRRNRLYLWR